MDKLRKKYFIIGGIGIIAGLIAMLFDSNFLGVYIELTEVIFEIILI